MYVVAMVIGRVYISVYMYTVLSVQYVLSARSEPCEMLWAYTFCKPTTSCRHLCLANRHRRNKNCRHYCLVKINA